MGWLYPYHTHTRRALINHLIHQSSDNDKCHIIKHCIRGNVLWAVYERKIENPAKEDRFIVCFLMQGNKEGW